MDKDKYIQTITEDVAGFISHMAICLPDDVKAALDEQRNRETSQPAASIYASMELNCQKAISSLKPICQDTGVMQFAITAGADFPWLGDIKSILAQSVRIATERTPLRPNTVETFSGINTGDNIGTGIPSYTWDIVAGRDDAVIDIYMAGGGCSLPGKSAVLMPSAGIEGVRDFVVEAILDRGINACPPLIVGVGIGTTADNAAYLSKKAVMRPINTQNKDPKASLLEQKIEQDLNALGIGPQGLTGSFSVLGVNLEWSAHHPAVLAVGVSTGCWATRRGRIIIDKEGKIEYVSHKSPPVGSLDIKGRERDI